MNITVAKLRKAGNRVRVIHERSLVGYKTFLSLYEIREKKLQHLIQPKKGRTILQLTTVDKKDFEATAICGKNDSFCRKTAVAICLGRLAKQVNLE